MDPRHLALLRIHDACRGLSDEEIETIASHVEVVHLAAGEMIHTVGQDLGALYIVVGGRLKMAVKSSGGGARTVRYISAGDQFGVLMLVCDEEFPVDVSVDQRALLLKLPKDAVLQLVERFPVFRKNLLRKIGHSVHQAIDWRGKHTNARVVAFFHADQQSQQMVAAIARRLTQLGEKIGVLCDSNDPSLYESGIPFKSFRTQSGDYADLDELRSTIEQWPHVKRVLLVVDPSHPAANRNRIFELSDSVFCLSRSEHYHSSVKVLEGLIGKSPSWKKKTNFVWVLDKDEQVAPRAPELQTLATRDFKVALPDSQSDSRLASQGIDRVVHQLRGVSIGLALSGGAAHGMAHLGVLRAMEEAGITIDRLAGTSAGVLTGVLYCAGYSTEWGVKAFARDLQPGSIYNWFPKGDGLYLLEKYRSHSWDKMLRKYLQDWKLEQLPIPVSTVTTDLIAAESVERSFGDSVESILESINLPVLSPPICRDGRLLVDGGIVNNLPADVLVKQGCNFVIGVDVAAHVEHRVGDNFPETPTSDMKTPGIVTTLLRCLQVQAHNMSRVGASAADVIVAPDVSRFEPTEFTRTQEMAEVGYQATNEALPQIRELLNQMDGEMFRAT